MDLLGAKTKLFGFRDGHLVLFDRSALGRAVVVTLSAPSGVSLTERVFLMNCPQRVSFRYGNAEGYGDVGFQAVSGRLTGCQFVGDWWVRGLPMFGQSSHVTVPEGYVQSDGVFSVVGAMSGSRHLFVIGKGRDAVKVISANLLEARTNNLGVIDLAGACPQ